MAPSRAAQGILLLGVGAVWGCIERPPFVLLTVRDPDELAGTATALRARLDEGEWRPVEIDGELEFPFEINVVCRTACRESPAELVWVEALDEAAGPLARGRQTVELETSGTPLATVTLRRACTGLAECDDGRFCSGVESCVDGMCEPGAPPCGETFPCVVSRCVEEAGGSGACSVSVDHDECPANSYCDIEWGCMEGLPCQTDADCQDEYVCDGAERCVLFRCEQGQPPDLEDFDSCTIDGCDDERTANQLPPEFHLAIPELDGNLCDLPGGGSGICLASGGGCVPSRCGDGFPDASLAGEACDDGDAKNSDAWALAPHCNADCSGPGPSCGDGVEDEGYELCDDGDTLEQSNGCSASCQRLGVCGDFVTQEEFEGCDDGVNRDNCDGCRDSCLIGCVCGSGDCGFGAQCFQGLCVQCNTTERCGPGCLACGGQTPVCLGADIGCGCSGDSCGIGAECVDGACVLCDTTTHCGPACGSCAEPTPECGGWELGCITTSCEGRPDNTPCGEIPPVDSRGRACLAGTCQGPGECQFGCGPSGPTFPLSDTGQTQCLAESDWFFDCSQCEAVDACGQDGDTGWDTNHSPNERFTRTGDVAPIVQDQVTGLMWQGCSAGLSGADCTAGEILCPGVWGVAEAYCVESQWGGYRDWRLPGTQALLSFIPFGNREAFDAAFPEVEPNYYWTMNRGLFSFYVGIGTFGLIYSMQDYAIDTACMRCVRGPEGGPVLSDLRFTIIEPPIDHPGELVTRDQLTGLEWQTCPLGLSGIDCTGGVQVTTSWVEAIRACRSSIWSGTGGWYLPNVIELYSVIQTRSGIPVFPDVGSLEYWTSTPTYTNAAATVWSQRAEVATGFKTEILNVRCVRRF